jgi:acyl-CoA thioesterase FadM
MVDSGTDVMVAEAKLRYHESARFDDEVDVRIRVGLGPYRVEEPEQVGG